MKIRNWSGSWYSASFSRLCKTLAEWTYLSSVDLDCHTNRSNPGYLFPWTKWLSEWHCKPGWIRIARQIALSHCTILSSECRNWNIRLCSRRLSRTNPCEFPKQFDEERVRSETRMSWSYRTQYWTCFVWTIFCSNIENTFSSTSSEPFSLTISGFFWRFGVLAIDFPSRWIS